MFGMWLAGDIELLKTNLSTHKEVIHERVNVLDKVCKIHKNDIQILQNRLKRIEDAWDRLGDTQAGVCIPQTNLKLRPFAKFLCEAVASQCVNDTKMMVYHSNRGDFVNLDNINESVGLERHIACYIKDTPFVMYHTTETRISGIVLGETYFAPDNIRKIFNMVLNLNKDEQLELLGILRAFFNAWFKANGIHKS